MVKEKQPHQGLLEELTSQHEKLQTLLKDKILLKQFLNEERIKLVHALKKKRDALHEDDQTLVCQWILRSSLYTDQMQSFLHDHLSSSDLIDQLKQIGYFPEHIIPNPEIRTKFALLWKQWVKFFEEGATEDFPLFGDRFFTFDERPFHERGRFFPFNERRDRLPRTRAEDTIEDGDQFGDRFLPFDERPFHERGRFLLALPRTRAEDGDQDRSFQRTLQLLLDMTEKKFSQSFATIRLGFPRLDFKWGSNPSFSADTPLMLIVKRERINIQRTEETELEKMEIEKW